MRERSLEAEMRRLKPLVLTEPLEGGKRAIKGLLVASEKESFYNCTSALDR